MESCEDDTDVESIDGSTSFSSDSETDSDDKPPDSTTLANLESCDTKDDLISLSPSPDDTEEQEDSTNAVTLKPGNLVKIIIEVDSLLFQFYLPLSITIQIFSYL